MNSCPISSCTSNARSGQLMCPRHWRQVPRELNRQVYATWRFIRHRDGKTVEQLQGGIADYRAARDSAIAAVNAAESPLCP